MGTGLTWRKRIKNSNIDYDWINDELDELRQSKEAPIDYNTLNTIKITPNKELNSSFDKSKVSSMVGGATGLFNNVLGNINYSKYDKTSNDFVYNADKSTASYGGIAYKLLGEIDEHGELDRISDENASNTFGSTLSGAASGATAGSVAGPWGAAIGGVVGGLTGLFGGIFGGNAREEEAMKLLRIAKMKRRYYNEEQLADAKNKSYNIEFDKKYGALNNQIFFLASKGKPSGVNPITMETYDKKLVSTAFGPMFRTQNGWGEKNERMILTDGKGNPISMYTIKSGKNDTAPIYADDNTFIASNRTINPETGNTIAHDAPSYIRNGRFRDLEINQEIGNLLNDMKDNKTRNGLPKKGLGGYLNGNLITSLSSLLAANRQYSEASDVRKNYDVTETNPYEKYALDLLNKINISYLPIAQENLRQLQSAWSRIQKSGGLSAGQKANIFRKLTSQTQRNNQLALSDVVRQNNAYKTAAANAYLQAGQDKARLKMQANMFNEDMLNKAHNAALQGRQMSLFNAINAMQQYYANQFKKNQFDRTLALYQLELGERKADRIAKYNNIGTNNITPSSVTYNNLQPYLYNGIGSGMQLGPGLRELDLSKFKRYAR